MAPVPIDPEAVRTAASHLPEIRTTTGMWNLVVNGLQAVFGGGLLVVILALIKNAPRWRELGMTFRKDQDEDLWARITSVESRLDAATQAAHQAELKVVYAVSAVQLLAARVRAEWPDDPTLKQAMELLAAATGGVFPGFAQKLADGITAAKP